MTNGDKIRQMTDEELADVMQGQCACCAYQLTGCTERECKDGAYEWLQNVTDEEPELIDRQAAIKLLNEMQDKATTGLEDVTLYRAIKVLREMPTIEAEPVKRGEWIDNGEDKFICSACKGYVYRWFGKSDFCPRCSADMRRVADEDA